MEKTHAVTSTHLPSFITEPGGTDFLMIVAAIVLVLAVLGAGVFFLWLHSLPERMVHNRLQYDLVAVLALLSLFTHVHGFWIAALLLAFVTVPDMSRFDFIGPLRSIAKSLRSLADREAEPTAAPATTETSTASVALPSAGTEPAAREG